MVSRGCGRVACRRVRPPEVPPAVRQLIAEHLESVAQLEVLLLLRAAADRAWSIEEVAQAQVTRPAAAAGYLAQLELAGLVVREGAQYRYAPSADRGPTLDALADAYAKRRQTVVGLIFSGPDDDVTSLADAFRLRRRRS